MQFTLSGVGSDLKVFDFVLRQSEGGFATLDVTVNNPRRGLLSGSVSGSFSVTTEEGTTALFNGRLIGVPSEMTGETVKLSFQARPEDFDEQKREAAEALRVEPFYDRLWVAADRREDPDAVLEFYPKLWHTDRVSLTVTPSDIIDGEGGSIDFGENVIYDDTTITYGSPPLRAIQVDGQVTWNQQGFGTVDFSGAIKAAFAAAGSGNGGYIKSLTGGGLTSDWPEKGDRIGSGWTVGESSVERVDNKVVVQEYVTVITDGPTARVPAWSMMPVLNADYLAIRQRSERARFTLRADCQAIVTEPDDSEVAFLNLASPDVGQPIDDHGGFPIGDAARAQYLPTDRGKLTITSLIAMARAQLLASSRAVEVTFSPLFEDALSINCRMNASVTDDRLPGGTATGKVIAYELGLNGDDGLLRASVTIGCAIGKGASLSLDPGAPDYAEDGYGEPGWQSETGTWITAIPGEVAYQDFSAVPPNDDGVNFFAMTPENLILSLEIHNGMDAQEEVLSDLHADVAEAVQALNEVYTEVEMSLKPLFGGPFETIYDLEVSELMVPFGINLEASA